MSNISDKVKKAFEKNGWKVVKKDFLSIADNKYWTWSVDDRKGSNGILKIK